LETTSEIQAANLPDFQVESRLRKSDTAIFPREGSLDDLMSGFEKEVIANTLEQNHFNLTKSAEQLKISRHALRYRMQRLNISGPDEEEAVPVEKESA
jgi:transcriptional regulator with PAS, ATPase and Fis domain